MCWTWELYVRKLAGEIKVERFLVSLLLVWIALKRKKKIKGPKFVYLLLWKIFLWNLCIWSSSLFTIAGSSISWVATVTGACVRPICIITSRTAVTLMSCRTLVYILRARERKLLTRTQYKNSYSNVNLQTSLRKGERWYSFDFNWYS